MVPHCGFNLLLSDGEWCWASFHMSLGPLYIFLGEVSVQVLCPIFIGLFVFLEWSHVSSSYILEIRPLSEVSLANMFPYTVGSLFIFMLFSWALQKLFNLMRFHVFILSFMSLALGDMSVRMLLRGMSEIFLPMFSSGTLWCYDLYLSLLSILSSFLCMV